MSDGSETAIGVGVAGLVDSVDGVRVSGMASAIIEENSFDGNSVAIRLSSMEVATVRDNVFRDNDRSLAFANENAFSSFPIGFAENAFEGSGSANSVLLPTGFTTQRTIEKLPVHYELSSTTLRDGADMTI